MKDYYKILGVTETATQEEISIAYKKKIKEWHPDLNKSDEAMSKTQELNEAYAALSDEAKKQSYDAQRTPFNRSDSGIPRGFKFSQQGQMQQTTVVFENGIIRIYVNGVQVQ